MTATSHNRLGTCVCLDTAVGGWATPCCPTSPAPRLMSLAGLSVCSIGGAKPPKCTAVCT